jgi:hypothetical protein
MTLRDLFVALWRRASRIHDIVILYVHDGSTRRKKVRLVGHAKLGLPDVIDGSHLVAVDCPASPQRQSSLGVRVK